MAADVMRMPLATFLVMGWIPERSATS
jgi:hypothetical protein